jgi:hypothetical protein
VKAVIDLIDTTDPAWPGILGVLREFKEAGIELDAAAATTAVKLGRKRWKGAIPATAPVQSGLAVDAKEIVYYIRRGAVIKIGTTKDPIDRFGTLMPDEILAIEPGSYELETARHKQFDHLRVRRRREYFIDAPELREHIKATRALYGEPDPAWPTTAAGLGDPSGWPSIAIKTTEMLTAIEAEEQLRIKRGTIWQWHRRGRIQSAGTNDAGQLLFYRDHLAQLNVRPFRRRAATLENFDPSLYGV